MFHIQRQRLITSGALLGSLTLILSLILIPRTQAANGPALSVDVAADRHAISPNVYGITFWWGSDKQAAETAFARAIKLPVNRSGGDATTRYNWQVDASNAGDDWYFTGGARNADQTPTPGATNDRIVDANRSVGAQTVMTVPIIQWINKSSAWTCSFPESVYGTQDSYNPYIQHSSAPNDRCGNGRKNGALIQDTHIDAHDQPNDPAIQKAWVQHLVQKYGTAANGGVGIYQLDNEPSGWLAIHRDVHPQGVGYTELRDRSQQYAAAIKQADPSAQTLGPGDIPYAYQDCNNCGSDGAAAHGNTPFGKWLLQEMADYERQHGVRLLDYYAMHYPGCCGSDAMELATERIRLFRSWINEVYPGTKLAFDEYNWGDASKNNTLPNALQTADGLGLFGREGVDLASFWGMDDVTWPVAYSFRMYRNYDGAGSAFGETSVRASSADQGRLAVYAAQRSSDGALTIMVINKSDADQTSNVALSGFTPGGSAHVYRYSGANLNAIIKQADQTASASGFSMTYPANSITLVALARAGAQPQPTTTGTPTGPPTVTSTPPAQPTGTPSGTPTPAPTCPAPSPVPTVAGVQRRAFLPWVQGIGTCR